MWRSDMSLVEMIVAAEMQAGGGFTTVKTKMQMRATDPRRQQRDAENNQEPRAGRAEHRG